MQLARHAPARGDQTACSTSYSSSLLRSRCRRQHRLPPCEAASAFLDTKPRGAPDAPPLDWAHMLPAPPSDARHARRGAPPRDGLNVQLAPARRTSRPRGGSNSPGTPPPAEGGPGVAGAGAAEEPGSLHEEAGQPAAAGGDAAAKVPAAAAAAAAATPPVAAAPPGSPDRAAPAPLRAVDAPLEAALRQGAAAAASNPAAATTAVPTAARPLRAPLAMQQWPATGRQSPRCQGWSQGEVAQGWRLCPQEGLARTLDGSVLLHVGRGSGSARAVAAALCAHLRREGRAMLSAPSDASLRALQVLALLPGELGREAAAGLHITVEAQRGPQAMGQGGGRVVSLAVSLLPAAATQAEPLPAGAGSQRGASSSDGTSGSGSARSRRAAGSLDARAPAASSCGCGGPPLQASASSASALRLPLPPGSRAVAGALLSRQSMAVAAASCLPALAAVDEAPPAHAGGHQRRHPQPPHAHVLPHAPVVVLEQRHDASRQAGSRDAAAPGLAAPLPAPQAGRQAAQPGGAGDSVLGTAMELSTVGGMWALADSIEAGVLGAPAVRVPLAHPSQAFRALTAAVVAARRLRQRHPGAELLVMAVAGPVRRPGRGAKRGVHLYLLVQ